MPTYEFRCPDGHQFDRFFRKISDAVTELPCPVCGKTAARQVSGGAGLLFKGSGFYLTDYGKNAHRAGGPATAGGEAKSGGESSKPAEGGGSAGGGSDASAGGARSAGESSGGTKSSDAGSTGSSSSAPKKADG